MKRFTILVAIIGAAVAWLWTDRSGVGSGADRHAHLPSKGSVEASSTPVATAPIKIHVFGTVRVTGDFVLSKPSLAEALSRGTPYVLSDLKKVRIYHVTSGIRVKDETVDAARILEPGAPDVSLADDNMIFVPEKIL